MTFYKHNQPFIRLNMCIASVVSSMDLVLVEADLTSDGLHYQRGKLLKSFYYEMFTKFSRALRDYFTT